uniref:C2 domain-containing protein n=1 Tax=Salarias fasciatus TaxID=181472 RepID=A0A672HGE4_SALFA
SRRGSCFKTQKSLSESDISKAIHVKDPDESITICFFFFAQGSNSSIGTECGLFESVAVSGELELALAYSTHTSCLEITVGACRNLTYGDSKKKKCHPFVKLHVLPDKSPKLKTSVKRNTTDPVYNEVLKRHLLIGKRLQASVWHLGKLRRKTFLGEVLLPLDGWTVDDKFSQGFNWYPLCPKKNNSAICSPVIYSNKLQINLIKTDLSFYSIKYIFENLISYFKHYYNHNCSLFSRVGQLVF